MFLLTVLCTVLVSGWIVLGWMDDAQRLPLSKLVLTGDRHYTRNDDIRQSILALGAPGTFMSQDVNIIQSQIERLPGNICLLVRSAGTLKALPSASTICWSFHRAMGTYSTR